MRNCGERSGALAVVRVEVEGLMYVTCEIQPFRPSEAWDASYRGRREHATGEPRTSEYKTRCEESIPGAATGGRLAAER